MFKGFYKDDATTNKDILSLDMQCGKTTPGIVMYLSNGP